MSPTEKILAIVGPTAVGKSELAVALARKFNGEVISADSRQVYRGLDIGTGKITKKETGGVRHYLLDIASPRRQYSAAAYVKDARRAISKIRRRGKIPVICGGTGFYIAVLLGEIQLPEAPPNPALRARLEKKPAAELFKMLQKLDPVRAAKIDGHNPRRIVRAIELAKTTKSERKNSQIKHTLIFHGRENQVFDGKTTRILKIGLKAPKEELKRRIRARLRARMRRGLVAEVKRLRKEGLSWKRMEELGLEYRYLSRHLRGKMTAAGMEERLATEIWRYARRQMTWFRRDKEIRWFSPAETLKIAETAKKFLGLKQK